MSFLLERQTCLSLPLRIRCGKDAAEGASADRLERLAIYRPFSYLVRGERQPRPAPACGGMRLHANCPDPTNADVAQW
jgi:hypothetical protein